MKLKRIIDPFLLLSKAERNGALVLLLIIALLLVIRLCIPVYYSHSEREKLKFELTFAEYEKEKKMEMNNPSSSKASKMPQYYNSKEKPIAKTDLQPDESYIEVELFQFDPNGASYDELLILGFSKSAATNLINYRLKGGKFRTQQDVLKIYGVDSALYSMLHSYISIENKANVREIVDINHADSATLTTLSGIGPVFASRICKYRERLGGFIEVEQLKEVYKFSEDAYNEVHAYIKADSDDVKKMNINFAEINELKNHPYCTYESARKIVDYRSAKGYIASLEMLVADLVIDSTTYLRLKPYLKIE
jgi:DNA uptake protein ComE-like DNA-binding protein